MKQNKCVVCKQELKLWKCGRNYRCSFCETSAWDKGNNIPCEICNKRILVPVVHHIDGNPHNNNRENRVGICISCHMEIHNSSKKEGKNDNKKSFEKNYNIKKYINLLYQYLSNNTKTQHL